MITKVTALDVHKNNIHGIEQTASSNETLSLSRGVCARAGVGATRPLGGAGAGLTRARRAAAVPLPRENLLWQL